MKSCFSAALIVLVTLAVSAGCIVPVDQTQRSEEPVVVIPQADINLTIGPATGAVIRPLLGINIGPIPAGTTRPMPT